MIINLKYYTYDCGTSTSVKEIYHLMILVIMEMLGMMKMTTILQFNDDGLMMLGITRTSGQGRPNCLEIPVSLASLPSTYHQRNVVHLLQMLTLIIKIQSKDREPIISQG